MSHDVFISYSSLDKLAAGVNAWMASGEPTVSLAGGGQ